MTRLYFQWDNEKNRINQKKHGVSFEEAKSVFYDDNAVQFWDENHSDEAEDRFLLLGRSSRMRILIVVHCFRETDSVIRIISARKATERERQNYQG